jgi:hypothetical protein
MQKEIWKDIVGYEGLYQVSNLGRIKSFARTWICGDRNSKKNKPETISKLHHNKQKYLQVWLCKNGEPKNFRVHRLVAQAFIPNPQNKKTINHINGVKDDNRVENLEWLTIQENLNHALINNLRVFAKGEKHGNSVLTKEKVLEIRKMQGSFTKMDIAKKFNVSHKTIRAVLNRSTWQHV